MGHACLSSYTLFIFRGYYDEPIYQPVIDQSKEMVMAKRARIIQLVQELNNFKHLDSETNNIVNSINSLQLELCMEEAMELEDTSKKLRKKVEDKRRYVLDILSNLLKEKGIPEEKDVSLVFLNTEKQESSLVQVAGKANYARCKRCEDLDDEEVCGDNGQTYRSLCHAVNCAGLALRDISAGSCATKVRIVLFCSEYSTAVYQWSRGNPNKVGNPHKVNYVPLCGNPCTIVHFIIIMIFCYVKAACLLCIM